ncbi:hypothetical protein [Agarilytica rhodophyticola]|uniref:hypothetical protein n=1 Tax=Agarilytica rhodophyticola TaxID=1737490 RepID=UPI000B342336|nr:hypothetical protein [Agarilytica rhodophyticola]
MKKQKSNSSIDNKAWLKFWYSPHNYIDSSWLEEENFSPLKKYRSSMVWQSCYSHVCHTLGLEPNLSGEIKPEWKNILCKISENPDKAISLASIAYSKDITKPAPESNISLDEYRYISQIGQGLALKQRFPIPDDLQYKNQKGLWLLQVALSSDCPEVWPRMKLAFKSSVLSNLPKLAAYSHVDLKNLKRLWNIIVCKL